VYNRAIDRAGIKSAKVQEKIMGPLPNVRQEKFVQALFEGHSATKSYELAGYRPNQGNSSRLKWYDMVQRRLSELQAAVAKKSEVTVQSLLDELEYARSRADSLDQLSAAVKATSEKAKISGLLVQKIEVGGPNEFNGNETEEEIAEAIIRSYQVDGKVYTEIEQEELRAIVMGFFAQLNEFLDTRGRYPWVAEGRLTDNGGGYEHKRS
jgi:phage terminase small subunit